MSLEQAFAIDKTGEGVWRVVADRRYEAGTGMFGGWTAGVLVRAVQQEAEGAGSPSAITVNYVRMVPPGSELEVRVALLGATRSISHWRATLHNENAEDVLAHATVVLSQRRESDAFIEPSMPQIPGPEDLANISPPGSFGQQTLMRAPFESIFDRDNTLTAHWSREISGRAVDFAQLAYMADAYPPRILLKGRGPRPVSTLMMAVFFHTTAEELARIGDDYVLIEAVGLRGEQSTCGQSARIWSRDGALLASTEQLVWFR